MAPTKVYCVDHLWSEPRHEKAHLWEEIQPNIIENCKAGPRPKLFDPTAKETTLAIVGYGPSLRDNWEKLKDYSHIWTVSGAHDFLLARGIVPTFHTDIDFRPHKPGFI